MNRQVQESMSEAAPRGPGGDPAYHTEARILGLAFRYGGAVVAVATATGLRWLLQDYFATGVAFITYFPTVALVAMLAGGGPGLLATVLSAAIVGVWQGCGTGGASGEFMAMGLFIASGLIISTTAEMLRRARQREVAGLAEQVAERTNHLQQANAWLRQEIEDRQQAEKVLRESEQRLQLMADSLPVLISYVDADSRYQFTNARYEDWFGLPREAHKNRHLREVLGEAAYEAIKEHVEAALAGQLRTFEGRVPYQAAGPRDVLVNYVPHRNQDGKVVGFYALILDLSERKRAEEALRDREARLRAILDTAVDAIITIDEHGIVESVNPSAEKLFGYTAGEMVGRNIKILMPSPYRDEHDRYLATYQKTGVKHIIGSGREVQALRKDGSVFPVELAVSEVRNGRRWFTGILHDLTRRKELELEVVEIASLEQRRIGQDLHDTVGQELTGLGLMAETLRADPATGAELIERIAQGLRRCQKELRIVLRGLLPVPVDAEGLMAALDDLADRTRQEGSAHCTFDCPEPVTVADNLTATHLYLIAREAVHNAVKHARPRHIRITLESAVCLILCVHDDGIGMPAQPTTSQGVGLRIMRNRAAIIGATLTIEPGRPTGTVVTCALTRMNREQG